MRVLLVNMPWAATDTPSLALGVLRSAVETHAPTSSIRIRHAHLDFVDWLADKTPMTQDDYLYFSVSSYFLGSGDWVFSSALHDDPEWRVNEFRKLRSAAMSERMMNLHLELHRLTPSFISGLARELLLGSPDVIGFTSTFQQSVAALAVARHIKLYAPQVITVIGGANCDGVQGSALHRAFPFVDFVCRGESDIAFPMLLNSLDSGRSPAKIPGLCWKSQAGIDQVNDLAMETIPSGNLSRPDYSDYFERLRTSVAAQWAAPKLVVEGSRGCWWGEKHHCKFCGLNGSSMQYRSKGWQSFFTEVIELVRKHQILDIIVVDNIMAREHLRHLAPALARVGYDLRLQYEVKSNMGLAQLAALVAAGIIDLQPGIESLSTRVLGLMDKGVTGCQNVMMLRDAETVGLTVVWNYLYGFPGETSADYESIVAQVSTLAHLSPPSSCGRIAIERFSPYYDNPALGFRDLLPDDQYYLNHSIGSEDLRELAYLFRAASQGISDRAAASLHCAIDAWSRQYEASRFTYAAVDGLIVLTSRRPGVSWYQLILETDLELWTFEQLQRPRSLASLIRDAALRFRGKPKQTPISRLVHTWQELGVVFGEGNTYVQVATEQRNQQLLRDGGIAASNYLTDLGGGSRV